MTDLLRGFSGRHPPLWLRQFLIKIRLNRSEARIPLGEATGRDPTEFRGLNRGRWHVWLTGGLCRKLSVPKLSWICASPLDWAILALNPQPDTHADTPLPPYQPTRRAIPKVYMSQGALDKNYSRPDFQLKIHALCFKYVHYALRAV